MYTIIIFAIIGFIAGVWSHVKEWGWKESVTWVMGCVISVVASIPGLIIALVLPTKTETVQWTLPLTALQDGKTISGSFWLGSGQIN